MPRIANFSALRKKFRNVKNRPSLLRLSITVLALSLWVALTVLAQSPEQPLDGANRLPPTTGDALTIKPVDMGDVDCMIAQWNAGASRPTLTVICPPESVFAPLRVLIKLAWMKPGLAPAEPGKIPFRVGALTRIRTNKDAAQIWLLADRGHSAQEEWVAFDAVGDLALLLGRPTNKPPKKSASSPNQSASRNTATHARNAMPTH